MEKEQSVPIEKLFSKGYYVFTFSNAAKLDELIFRRNIIAREAYDNVGVKYAFYANQIDEIENEIKKLLNID